MAAEEVYINVPVVRDIAKKLDAISEVLKGVCYSLEAIAMTLKATAFLGLPGNAIATRYIDLVKPQIEQIASKCAELCQDVHRSVDAYERGDQLGAARFH